MAAVRPALRQGEALGYDTTFLPEIAGRDALVALAALAGDPFAARERVDENGEAGADLPVVYPVATSDDPIGSVARTLIAAVPV